MATDGRGEPSSESATVTTVVREEDDPQPTHESIAWMDPTHRSEAMDLMTQSSDFKSIMGNARWEVTSVQPWSESDTMDASGAVISITVDRVVALPANRPAFTPSGEGQAHRSNAERNAPNAGRAQQDVKHIQVFVDLRTDQVRAIAHDPVRAMRGDR